jgi:hypothetical protein
MSNVLLILIYLLNLDFMAQATEGYAPPISLSNVPVLMVDFNCKCNFNIRGFGAGSFAYDHQVNERFILYRIYRIGLASRLMQATYDIIFFQLELMSVRISQGLEVIPPMPSLAFGRF